MESRKNIIKVTKNGRLVHGNSQKYWRDNIKKWKDLRADKEADIDLNEWAKSFEDEWAEEVDDAKAHFFVLNPGIEEVLKDKLEVRNE